jgi:hypothetical protein
MAVTAAIATQAAALMCPPCGASGGSDKMVVAFREQIKLLTVDADSLLAAAQAIGAEKGNPSVKQLNARAQKIVTLSV